MLMQNILTAFLPITTRLHSIQKTTLCFNNHNCKIQIKDAERNDMNFEQFQTRASSFKQKNYFQ